MPINQITVSNPAPGQRVMRTPKMTERRPESKSSHLCPIPGGSVKAPTICVIPVTIAQAAIRRNVRAFGQPGERHQGNTKNAGRCYCALLKPMLSGTTVDGPTGNHSAWSMLNLVKAIFSLHTFLRRSLKKPMVRNSPAQRRYPKPNGAYPASSHTG